MEQEHVLWTNSLGMVFLLAKEFLRMFKNKNEQHDEAILQNTVAISKLTIQFEHLSTKINETLPELKEDMKDLQKILLTMNKKG